MGEPANDPHDEFMEKSWPLLNLQMDAMLEQGHTEMWKVAIAAMGAGAALVTAGAGIGAALAHVGSKCL